jgi:hypothetical protein
VLYFVCCILGSNYKKDFNVWTAWTKSSRAAFDLAPHFFFLLCCSTCYIPRTNKSAFKIQCKRSCSGVSILLWNCYMPRRRKQIPIKPWQISTKLHGITSQNIIIPIFSSLHSHLCHNMKTGIVRNILKKCGLFSLNNVLSFFAEDSQ